MIDHGAIAEELFLNGYNCAQSVVAAFSDVTGLDLNTSVRLASGLGGGMGRLREVCGAFSGAVIVMGLICGYDEAGDAYGKARTYLQVQDLAAKFREKNRTIICRELLENAGQPASDAPTPSPRTEQYYAQRPCAKFVHDAAALVDEMFLKQE